VITQSLAEMYRERCLATSDIFEHLPTLVDLVVEHDCQNVLELGVCTGNSTVAFLYALEQTGGSLTSVDLDDAPPIGEHPHWSFIQGDDVDPQVFAQCDLVDLLFIDTDHGYRHTLQELYLYSHLVRRPGLIVLHDTELEHPIGEALKPAFPVKKAVTEFCESEGYEFTNNPACYGLAVIRVV
jgi:cephalosporin hydroxylase